MVIQQAVRRARERVINGAALSESFAAEMLFPSLVIRMLKVGESTGALQEMLTSLADFYDEDVETEVSRFVTLVEPVMLVFMGVVIAGVVLALYMPLFQLSTVVGR